jgi:hypothetical protein
MTRSTLTHGSAAHAGSPRGPAIRRGKIRRGAILLASTAGSIGDLARGIWQSGPGRRWLLPLAVFLCVTGLVLILAASVEALAPFIYSIF